MELAYHRLPDEFLDTLARGGGSRQVTRYLWGTERSRRLVLISELFDECDRSGGLAPLPSAEAAWSVLSRAHDADRAAIDALLLHPQVGNAAAYTLRRLLGDERLWVDLGYLHTLALVAAARAGLTWSTTVPARHNAVMLPTLGMARFPSAGQISTVDARTEAGTIVLSAAGSEVVVGPDPFEDTDSWWHQRHLTVGGDLRLTVTLDDLDPLRDLAEPVEPARLDDATVGRWRELLHGAWELLCKHHQATAAAMAEGVVALVPLPQEPGTETRSASNGEAFGSVLTSEPPDAVTLAVTLVHEFQHIKLGALMHLLTLSQDDETSLFYAPWRDDPRPLGGLLQGVYAFFGIAEFWRRQRLAVGARDVGPASYEYLYARNQTLEALRSISGAQALTEIGHSVLVGLDSVLTTWLADQVDAEVGRLARLTADSHRTAWRLRHHRVDATSAALLAEAWLNHEPPTVPPPPEVRPTPGTDLWPHRIPTLARIHIRGTRTPETPRNTLATADLNLVRGDVTAAAEAYLTRLAQPADGSDAEIRAWVGLALAASAGHGCDGAATTLLRRPDLVRAVHSEATVSSPGRTVDPVAIAAWLAPVTETPHQPYLPPRSAQYGKDQP